MRFRERDQGPPCSEPTSSVHGPLPSAASGNVRHATRLHMGQHPNWRHGTLASGSGRRTLPPGPGSIDASNEAEIPGGNACEDGGIADPRPCKARTPRD
ncbi:hypothetical protein VTH82DRAFT_7100 [Thermothelomyces myriococcoides]